MSVGAAMSAGAAAGRSISRVAQRGASVNPARTVMARIVLARIMLASAFTRF
jgi:hypothetical protein